MSRIFLYSILLIGLILAITVKLPFCRAKLCPPCLSDTDAVYFGFIKKGSIAIKTISLNVSRKENIIRCWSDCTYAKAFLTNEEQRVKITVVLDTRFLPAGQLRGSLYIQLDESTAPLFRIPFVGIVQDASKKSCCAD